MIADDNTADLSQWAAVWQHGEPHTATSVTLIRDYVKRRGNLVRSLMFADFVVGVVMLPIVFYLSWRATAPVERWSMLGLASIVIAAVAFSWWNWSGVLRASAATTADYIAVSLERLRRMRVAWRVSWLVLAAEIIVFSIWIRDRPYGGQDLGAASERFSWTWLGGFTLVAAVSLIWFGRWLSRDAARFQRLRLDLEIGGAYSVADSGVDEHR